MDEEKKKSMKQSCTKNDEAGLNKIYKNEKPR